MKPKRAASILAGVISLAGLTYAALASIWQLPYATEIQETSGVLVQFISGILAVLTANKIINESIDK
ncbi:MAG: hypothetical protein LBS33_03390 [Streptococcaceae bacterium]|nr:hypothetical protein [Streptococcaceae bacterium]